MLIHIHDSSVTEICTSSYAAPVAWNILLSSLQHDIQVPPKTYVVAGGIFCFYMVLSFHFSIFAYALRCS